MTETFDGNAPTSAVFAQAYWVSNTSEQTDRQFRASGSVQNNRGTGIIASFEPAAYQLDLEIQWNDVPSAMQSEVLAINTGYLDNENIRVDYWDGNNWNNLFSNLFANSWNNISIDRKSVV